MEEWQDKVDWVYMRDPKNETNEYLVIKSCQALEDAIRHGADAVDAMQDGIERNARRNCSLIYWEATSKPAAHNEIKYPVCIDETLYRQLAVSLDPEWGMDNLARIESGLCDKGGAIGILVFRTPLADDSPYTKSVRIETENLIEGDFDGDGWLDLIVSFDTNYLPAPEDSGFFARTDVGGLIKISVVNGKLTVSNMLDHFSSLRHRKKSRR